MASVTWSEGVLWGLAGFVGGFAVVGFMLSNRRRKRLMLRKATWEQTFTDAGLGGVEILDLRHTSRGLRLELRLPPRLTFPQLASATSMESLEISGALPRGGARVERDEAAAQTAWLHASLDGARDRKPSTMLLPDPGAGIASINNPLPIGVYDDDTLCMVDLAHANALVAGVAGDDTSTDQFFRVVTAQLVRCDDALVWFAAPGGTRLAAPWLTSRPPALDWVATDLDETERMLNTALKVVHRRSASGPAGDRLEPSADVPAVVVLIPDAGTVLGRFRSTQHRRLAAAAVELAQTGQREAVTLVAGMRQDSAAGMDLMDLRPYCRLRIGLGMTHHSGAWRIFPDMARPDRNALSDEGSMLVQQPGGRTMPARMAEMSRDDAVRIARECAQRRPELDAPSAAADAAYSSRWRRWRTAGAGADTEFHRIVDTEESG